MLLGHPALADDGVFTPGVETESKASLSTELREEGFEDRLLLAWAPARDLRFSVVIPLRQATSGVRRRVGFGDVGAGMRAVLTHRVRESGASDRVALDAGLVLPTGDTRGRVPVGGGSTDFEGGFSYGYSGRRWFAWTGLRGRLATEAGSDIVAGHASVGVRAARAADVELVLFLESSSPGARSGRDRSHPVRSSRSEAIA